MTVTKILSQLKAMGDAARRKHNAKAGAPDHQFGVKLGEVRALAKKLGTDHALGLELWETGNVEAQLVATQVLDPASLTAREVERLVKSVAYAQVADWLYTSVVKGHPALGELRPKWMKSKDRWLLRAGWNATAGLAAGKAEGLDLPALLDRIEAELAKADPVVQWTMNWTLGTIAIHHARLRPRAVAIGEAVGLYRDWPVSKGCTPPYVPVWVAAMVKRGA